MQSEPPMPAGEPAGFPSASNEERFAALYRELRQLADRLLRRNAGAMVSATTLLHEAYLDIAPRDARFADRAHFIGYAARVMRGLIIDLMRERRALKRGGAFHITQLHTGIQESISVEDSLSRLSESLDELARVDSRLAELVDLKYFCGYSFEDIATHRGTSVRTVQRDWQKARLVLFQKMTDDSDSMA